MFLVRLLDGERNTSQPLSPGQWCFDKCSIWNKTTLISWTTCISLGAPLACCWTPVRSLHLTQSQSSYSSHTSPNSPLCERNDLCEFYQYISNKPEEEKGNRSSYSESRSESMKGVAPKGSMLASSILLIMELPAIEAARPARRPEDQPKDECETSNQKKHLYNYIF